MFKHEKKTTGDLFTLYQGDAVEWLMDREGDPFDLTVHSPPFGSEIYVYSDRRPDMGNSQSWEDFAIAARLLYDALYEQTRPGGIAAIEIKDSVFFRGSSESGASGVVMMMLRLWEILSRKHWSCGSCFNGYYISEKSPALASCPWCKSHETLVAGGKWITQCPPITCWADPVTEREKTNAHGLLHKTVSTNSRDCRVGMPSYILVFRRWPEEHEMDLVRPCFTPGEDGGPIVDPHSGKPYRFVQGVDYGVKPPQGWRGSTRGELSEYSIRVWQQLADSVWKINRTDVLNAKKGSGDVKHPCPMPLPLYRRLMGLYACPGDLVGEPFSGHGSGATVAIEQGLRYEGCELKPEFYEEGVKNARAAEVKHIAQAKIP